jgi:antitoxin component HigA of HigAB toxin-antitoxin module
MAFMNSTGVLLPMALCGRSQEILNHASPLTLPEIRALHEQWGTSASVLISGDPN